MASNFPSLSYELLFLQDPTCTGDKEHNVGNRLENKWGCITATLVGWDSKKGRGWPMGHSIAATLGNNKAC